MLLILSCTELRSKQRHYCLTEKIHTRVYARYKHSKGTLTQAIFSGYIG